MRYLFYALLLATLIALAVRLVMGEVKIPETSPGIKSGNELSALHVEQPSEIWKDFGNLFLVSFSYVLVPVLGGYFLFRLVLTIHRILFTFIAVVVLINIGILLTGVLDVKINYDRLYELLLLLKDLFLKIGALRTTALAIGAIFGIRGYWADREN